MALGQSLFVRICEQVLKIMRKKKKLGKLKWLLQYLYRVSLEVNPLPQFSQLVLKILQEAGLSELPLYFHSFLKSVQSHINSDTLDQFLNLMTQRAERFSEQNINYMFRKMAQDHSTPGPMNDISVSSFSCLSCISTLMQNNAFHYHCDQSILLARKRVMFAEKINISDISVKACTIANQNGGHIFIGFYESHSHKQKCHIVIGVKYNSAKEQQVWKEKMKLELDKIYPKLDAQQYSISFIPVMKDFTQQFSCLEPLQSIIRIQVKPRNHKILYFVTSLDKSKKTFKSYLNNDHELHSLQHEKIYETILKKHSCNDKYFSCHYGLDCLEVERQVLISKKIDYGAAPVKKYQWHGLILVKREIGEREWDELKNGTEIVSYPIYEKLGQNIHYATYNGNFRGIKEQISQIDPMNETFVFIEIKKYFYIKCSIQIDHIFKILGLVKEKFRNLPIHCCLAYVEKEKDKGLKHIFEFQSYEHSIFAFALLASHHIRTEFISQQHFNSGSLGSKQEIPDFY